MAVKNNTIIKKAWLQGSNDFQQRVPEPTQRGIAETIKFLRNPLNRKFYNEFVDTLINRVGETVIRTNVYEHPFKEFQGQNVTYGNTIQEIAPKWIKAHSYDDASETLLRLERPEAAAWYHTVNREDRYPISVNDDESSMAFSEQYGLNQWINGIMQVPYNSDNYDTYNIVMQLFAFYEKQWGFFKEHFDKVPDDEDSSRKFLAKVQSYSDILKFPSQLYNTAHVPVFAKPEELVLFITPEAKAYMNVEGLAPLFHLDKAETQARIITVREFPVKGMFALLTTKDFLILRDKIYRTTSFYNPETLSTTYWLHHWSINSVSPFVPAICFTTEPGTDVATVSIEPENLVMTLSAENASMGDIIEVMLDLTGTTSDVKIPVKPDSAVFTLSANRQGASFDLNSRTYIDRLGHLHIQKTKLQPGDVITLEAESTYTNPGGDTKKFTAKKEITIK